MTPVELTQPLVEPWRVWACLAVVGAALLFLVVKLGGPPPSSPIPIGDLA